MRFGLEDLFRAWALVTEQALRVGLRGERVSDLVLPVNELAMMHGPALSGMIAVCS